MESFSKRNMTIDFGMELVNLNVAVAEQEMIIDKLMLKAAMYKANFFGKYDLADKLREQLAENMNARIGDFDGFCYCSARARAEYRTINDMFEDGLITQDELQFCNLL